MIVDSVLAPAGDRRPVGAAWRPASATFFSLPPLCIRDGSARRLQLPSKLMAQHKFGTRRRAMLSFERQPFPAPCHVDQDVAHSRAWCALRHLTTFDRVLSALHRRNHLPVPPGPCTQPTLPRGSRCGQHLSCPEYTSGPIVTFARQHTLRALRVRTLCLERPPVGFRVISKARSTSPTTHPAAPGRTSHAAFLLGLFLSLALAAALVETKSISAARIRVLIA